MTHGGIAHRTTHGSWEDILSYDPWAMGGYSLVRPMGHGRIFCRTTPWVMESVYSQILYNPRVMGSPYFFIMSYDPWVMGPICPRTVHGPWAFIPLVRHRISHGSWDFVT